VLHSVRFKTFEGEITAENHLIFLIYDMQISVTVTVQTDFCF